METMNTDTPETDGEWNRLACQDHSEFERNLADFARKLERERDATIAQQREEQRLHIQTLNERDEARQWESQALVARIQRDEWKAKYIQQNKDLGCEQMDPNGTIWDHAKKLQAELDAARKHSSEH